MKECTTDFREGCEKATFYTGLSALYLLLLAGGIATSGGAAYLIGLMLYKLGAPPAAIIAGAAVAYIATCVGYSGSCAGLFYCGSSACEGSREERRALNYSA